MIRDEHINNINGIPNYNRRDLNMDFEDQINLNINPHTRSLNITNNQSLILNLQRVWTNEKFSKDLLKYEEDFISEVKDLLEKKTNDLERLNSSHSTQAKDDAEILELDLDRIKFLIKDYLRIRLSKIDKYIYYIIKNDLNYLLSKTEFEFAYELFKLKKDYFNKGLIKKINESFNDFKPYPKNEEMLVAPPMNSYVCFKSVTFEPIVINLKEVWEESSETLIINRDEIYCLPLVLVK
jgi:hypothetical protein